MSLLKEISITEFTNLRIGHASNHDGQTGVTVLYFPQGAKVGCDISGGGCLPLGKHLSPLLSPPTIPSTLLYYPADLPMDWLPLTV